jgi:tetratricopeptide (TPR) repeat protein
MLAASDIDEAARLASQLVQVDHSNHNAYLVLGVRALKQKQWKEARAHFAQAAHGPVNDLVATLLSAWSAYAAGDTKGGVDAIDKLSGPEWYSIFKELHAGLISDVAGNKREAGKRYEQAFKADATIFRVVQSYAGFLSRNGQHDEALKIYQDYDKQIPHYPLTLEGLALLQRNVLLPRIVETAQEGAAEVLYGIGAAFAPREEEASLANRGLAYLQLALYLKPNNALAQVSLADFYERLKRPELAIKVFERVPAASPLKHNAEIQLALDLDALNRTDEAMTRLRQFIAAKPDDMEAILALANIQRERKQFDGCAETYSEAINLLPKPEKANWTTFYFRGICYERSKQWAKAEPDFRKALELYPDQPYVLNYLGYSWINQGVHLDEGMSMIKRSVEQKPDDGFIVDSLGWAYYRLGNNGEALKNLERAVELKPDDPTIHDHLGDVYRALNRISDARAQWSRSRELNPDLEDLRKLEDKLRTSVVAVVPPASVVTSPPAYNAATIQQLRVALVIGNSAYRSVPVLPNPRHDAGAVAEALRQAGFQTVELATDLDRDGMVQALRRFRVEADRADWALVYFAGHGIEIDRVNYLIPVDAQLIDDRDVKVETVSYDDLLNTVGGARGLRLIILDACRVNPFKDRMHRAIASRSATDRGLAAPPEPDAGTLVAYSARDGQVAADDVDGVNSPFARAFVTQLKVPGLEVRRLFDFIRDDVMEATRRRQQPFTYQSLPGRKEYFFVTAQ